MATQNTGLSVRVIVIHRAGSSKSGGGPRSRGPALPVEACAEVGRRRSLLVLLLFDGISGYGNDSKNNLSERSLDAETREKTLESTVHRGGRQSPSPAPHGCHQSARDLAPVAKSSGTRRSLTRALTPSRPPGTATRDLPAVVGLFSKTRSCTWIS